MSVAAQRATRLLLRAGGEDLVHAGVGSSVTWSPSVIPPAAAFDGANVWVATAGPQSVLRKF